ncbi:MAG TPA: S8 family serine peptidase, partial [Streptosporangiaceae bacterium]|nr:S8 family serine peptidase [Streptosporangiaceae bacterium]
TGRSSKPSARAIAEPGEVSPFSRSGPGIGPTSNKAIKPEVVEYGGNLVVNDAGLLEPENPGVSVVSTAMEQSGRLFRAGSGTSFSTPRVARLAADILGAYPNASANLLRCLIAISARVPEPASRQFANLDEVRRAVGYGRPAEYLALQSGGSRAVLLFQGDMTVDTAVVHPIPVPESFARGQWQRRVRVAVAFDPPVRRERREYVAATLRVDLVRNTDPVELQAIYEAQDPDERHELFNDRRRVALKPGSQAMSASTLQVRTWSQKRLDIDDGDTYYLVLSHRRQTWARTLPAYGTERYAVAIELDAEGQPSLDTFALLEQRLQPEVRLRLR